MIACRLVRFWFPRLRVNAASMAAMGVEGIACDMPGYLRGTNAPEIIRT